MTNKKSTEKRTETHACDLISRQAAVELAMKYCPDDDGSVQCDGDIRELLDELENLPSAQPEIIRCKDCKWKNRHNCTRAVEVFIDDDKYCAWAERRTDV